MTNRQNFFCICDAPNSEAVRRAAQRNRCPLDCISEGRGLDPYLSV